MSFKEKKPETFLSLRRNRKTLDVKDKKKKKSQKD